MANQAVDLRVCEQTLNIIIYLILNWKELILTNK
jgi:hypothetical protein